MKFKKLVCIVLAVMLLAGLGAFAHAEEAGITVVVDGKTVQFDQAPIIEDGRTLVPLRAIFEALNKTVEWDGNNQSVTVTNGNIKVYMTIGSDSPEIYYEGVKMIVPHLDVAPKIINGRTLVPVRFIAESAGCSVAWDATTKTITINSILGISFMHTDSTSNSERLVYSGYVDAEGYPHCYGSLKFVSADGTFVSYVGAFEHGTATGNGRTYDSETGITYSGEVKDMIPEGYGTVIYPDGTSETGNFVNGELIKADRNNKEFYDAILEKINSYEVDPPATEVESIDLENGFVCFKQGDLFGYVDLKKMPDSEVADWEKLLGTDLSSLRA